jgi:hypothetical protein
MGIGGWLPTGETRHSLNRRVFAPAARVIHGPGVVGRGLSPHEVDQFRRPAAPFLPAPNVEGPEAPVQALCFTPPSLSHGRPVPRLAGSSLIPSLFKRLADARVASPGKRLVGVSSATTRHGTPPSPSACLPLCGPRIAPGPRRTPHLAGGPSVCRWGPSCTILPALRALPLVAGQQQGSELSPVSGGQPEERGCQGFGRQPDG